MTLRPRTIAACLAAGLLLGCATGRFDRLVGREAPRADAIVYELEGRAAGPAVVAYLEHRGADEVRLASHGTAEQAAVVTAEGAAGPEDSGGGASSRGHTATVEPGFVRLSVERRPSRGRARVTAAFYASRPKPPSPTKPPAPEGASRHPTRVKPGSARVTDAPRPVVPVERPLSVSTLDVSSAEFDLLVQDLRSAGLFGNQERPEGGARVTVGRGEGAVCKEWTPEPRLDDLVERAVREGAAVPAVNRR